MAHEFLVLALLFLVPGGLVWWARPDLRWLLRRMALLSLPFATTEWLFYPEYWRPKFLFDLADRLGFGIEDVLFVVGLSAFTSSAYAVAFRRTLEPLGVPVRPWPRAVGAIALTLALAGGLLALGVPILYAAVAAMAGVSAGLLVRRADLLVPGLLGALVSGAVYLALCLVFQALLPGVFERTWRPSLLLRGTLLGVPLDEVLYGVGAGFGATVYPAWAFGQRFVRRPAWPTAEPSRGRHFLPGP